MNSLNFSREFFDLYRIPEHIKCIKPGSNKGLITIKSLVPDRKTFCDSPPTERWCKHGECVGTLSSCGDIIIRRLIWGCCNHLFSVGIVPGAVGIVLWSCGYSFRQMYTVYVHYTLYCELLDYQEGSRVTARKWQGKP